VGGRDTNGGDDGRESDVELFLGWLEALEKGAGEPFAELCARHPESRARLEALHAAHERARALLPSSAREREQPAPVAGSTSPASPERYELRGELARGGMGVILEAWDPALRRRIAMKVVRADRIRDGSSCDQADRQQSRLEAEAQILAQLDHPGVVAIHELGRDARGEPYFTMKCVVGQDLAHVIRRCHAGDPEWRLARAVRVLVRVCEAVAYAHAKGVIHRDLKPANVMTGRFGEVYVMDWGLAKVLGRPEPAGSPSVDGARIQTDRGDVSLPGSPLATEQGVVVGTPGYLAPEQARADLDAIGPSTDVYALGAMLYHLLAGRHPYARDHGITSTELVASLLSGPPEPLRLLAPRAPDELAAVAEKAMARDPGARYASALELAADLEAWLEGRVVVAHRTGAWIELQKWVGRNRGAAAAILAVVLGLASLSVVQSLRRRDLERAQRETALRAEELRREDTHNRVALASAALASGEISHMRELLAACPDDLRGWEWHHLWRESDTAERTLEFPGLDVKSAFLLGEGELLCGGSALPPRIELRDLESGRVLREIRLGDDEFLNDVSVSADGGTLAVFTRLGALRLWDAHTFEPLATLDAAMHGWHGVSFAPAGTLLAAYGTEGVELWDVASRSLLGRLSVDGQQDIADVGWSPDAARLFAGSWDGSVGVWDAAQRELVTVLRDSRERMEQVECSPDGRWIAGGDWDSRLLVWDARTLALVHRSDRIGGQVLSLAWSPDSTRVAVSGAGAVVQLFEAGTWEPIGRLVGHAGRVNTLAFTPDGRRVVSGCTLGTVRLWDLSRGDWRTKLHADGSEPPAGVVFAPDGRRIAVGWSSGVLELWDAHTRTRDAVWHTGVRIRHLDWSRDGERLALADWEHDVVLLDASDGHEIGRIAEEKPTEVHFDPAGARLAATASDGTLRVWNVADRSLAWSVSLPPTTHGWPGDLFGASWSSDGRELVACNFDGRIQVRDASTGTLRHETLRPGMLFVQFSRDGHHVLAAAYARNQGMELLDARTLERLWASEETGHLWPVLSPGGERVFTASWLGYLGVWDASSGRLVAQIDGLPPGNPRLGVSPDGSCVALAAGKNLALFDASDR